MTAPHAERERIRDALLKGTRFLVTSHARPDGDSLGSQLALAEALTQIGKHVTLVNSDPPPSRYEFLPGAANVEVAASVDGSWDAVVVLECSELDRTGVGGLDSQTLINIDHHTGNTMYGALNWRDESACACAELVFELVETLGARFTPTMATNVYVAILTDTGSFRHANITARTFEICRRIADTGVEAAGIATQVFNNWSIGRLRLTGQVLDQMQLKHDGQIAIIAVNDAMVRETGCGVDDMEGIANLPLTARDVQAVIFLKESDRGLRVSLRSKDGIDVRRVAVSFGGGGHKNASGLTIERPSPATDAQLVSCVAQAIAERD
ncbi:MAG: bifunctional oligoribonuclease/PAP phosphatase NrnA [Acidobacteriota bacterium]|nr:bifunctional oligoribonuclease/PAP phosphatase NrnA [Acidobacteriota bacterium]